MDQSYNLPKLSLEINSLVRVYCDFVYPAQQVENLE